MELSNNADFLKDATGNIPGFKNAAGESVPFVTATTNAVTGRIDKLTASGLDALLLSELRNFTPSTLQKWRKALGRSRAGGAPARLALIGDSTTRGSGSNGSGSVDIIKYSYPTFLSSMLTKQLQQSQVNSFWGDGTVGVALNVLDPRITLSGGWYASAVNSVGGKAMATSTAGTIAFTPAVACKTWDVWYIKSTGNGIFSLDIGGVGTTNFDTGSSGLGFAKATIVGGSASLSPLNIKYVSGNVFFIVAAAGYDDTDQIHVWNMGKSGAKVSDWIASTSSPWDPMAALGTIAPDLSIIDLSVNDAAQATAIATYKSGLQTLITSALTTGDVILKIGVPSNTSVSTQAAQDACRVACYELSESNGIPLIDLQKRFGTYTASNALGMFFDNYHPNGIGYSDIASIVTRAVSQT